MERSMKEIRYRGALAGAACVARRLLLAVALLVLSLPLARGVAAVYLRGSPTTTVIYTSPSPYRALAVAGASRQEADVVRSAASSLRYRLDARDLHIRVVEDAETAGPRQSGAYYGDGTILLRRSIVQVGGPALAWSLAHEFGHYVDETYLDGRTRAEFRAMRGIPAELEWVDASTEWSRRPMEDFADCFAAVDQEPPADTPTTGYGRIGDPAALTRLLAAQGLRVGTPAATRNAEVSALRDVDLYARFLRRPVIAVPLLALALLYAFLGARRRARLTRIRLTG